MLVRYSQILFLHKIFQLYLKQLLYTRSDICEYNMIILNFHQVRFESTRIYCYVTKRKSRLYILNYSLITIKNWFNISLFYFDSHINNSLLNNNTLKLNIFSSCWYSGEKILMIFPIFEIFEYPELIMCIILEINFKMEIRLE